MVCTDSALYEISVHRAGRNTFVLLKSHAWRVMACNALFNVFSCWL